MRKICISVIVAGLIACAGRSHQQEKAIVGAANTVKPAYRWTKLLDSAGWKKNYNFQMFSIRDTLWVFHPDGNWFSVDGMDWQPSSLPNAIHNLAFLDYIFFKERMYGLGHFDGNIETFRFRPDIFRSTSLRSWDTLSDQSNLPPRFFYHPFVFRDSIWIIGGEDRQGSFNDIWNSPDGIHWTRQAGERPFGRRSNSQVVQLKDTLYLLNNDVWKSTDGRQWTLVTKEIVPGAEIFGYAALVFDGKIWLLGCNRNGQFTSQVLSSADGKSWEGSEAPWLPRGGIAAVNHNGKVYMTGGKYGGTPNHPDFRYDNDVWVLEKSD